MAIRRNVQLGYDFAENLTQLAPIPIISNVNPGVRDQAPLGQLWINKVANSAYVLVSVAAGLATWQLIEAGGGAGNFANLTVNPGPTNLTGALTANSAGNPINIATDAAASTISIGNNTGATSITENVGTGNWAAQGVGASQFVLGGGTVGGNIFVGGALQTGQIQVGYSTAGQTVFIAAGVNVAPNIVSIANGAAAANTTVNMLSGNATAGVQTLNVLNGNRAGAANIGTGAAAHVVTIGSATAGNVTNLNSPVTNLPGPVQVLTGAGAPAGGLALHVGDLYINTTAATAATRMYIATAAGTWTNITCAG